MYLGNGGFVRLTTNGTVFFHDASHKGQWQPPSPPLAIDQEEMTVLCHDGTQYQLSMAFDSKAKTYYPTGTLRAYPLAREKFYSIAAEAPGVKDYDYRFLQIHPYKRSKYLALKPGGRLAFILPGFIIPHRLRSVPGIHRYFYAPDQIMKSRYRYPTLQPLRTSERIEYIHHYEGCFLLVGKSGMLYRLGHTHPALQLLPHLVSN